MTAIAIATYIPPQTGGVKRGLVGKLAESVSLKDFGAVMDGTTNDTAAWNLAIVWLAGKSVYQGRHLLIDGQTKVTPSSLTWQLSNPDGSTVGANNIGSSYIELNGTINVTSTLWLPANVTLVGLGGPQSIQFSTKCSGAITKASAFTGPTVKLASSGDDGCRLKNIAIYGSGTGPALQVGFTGNESGFGTYGQTALVWLEGIYCYHDVAGQSAVELNNVFWLWVKDFAFICAPTGLAAVRIGGPGWPGPAQNTNGLLHFENGVIAGKGFLFNRSYAPGGGYENFFMFRNIIYESAGNSFVTMQVSGGGLIGQMTFENIEAADSASGSYLLKMDAANGNTATVQGVFFRQCPAVYMCGIGGDGQQIRGVDYSGGGNSVYAGQGNQFLPDDLDFWPRGSALASQGITTAAPAFAPNALSPAFLPTGFIAYAPNTLSGLTCDVGTGTVTGGKMAPDGSTGAIEVSTTSGARLSMMATTGYTIADDDFIVAGAFVRLISSASWQRPRLRLYCDNGGTAGSGFEDYGPEWDCTIGPSAVWFSGWGMLADVIRYTNNGTADMVSLHFQTFDTMVYQAWAPFLIRVPVALGWKRQDIVAWVAGLTGVPQSGGAGVAAQLPGLAFKSGRAATGSLPSASAVGQGASMYDTTRERQAWSNGTTWDTADTLRERTLTSADTIIASDHAKRLICTTASVTHAVSNAATLGAGFSCEVWNDTAGTIVLNGSGATDVTLAAGEVATVGCSNSKVKVVKGTSTVIS